MDQGTVRELMAAAQQGDKKVLLDIIAKGKVGVVDEEATTPLMYAAASGREEILRIILDKECLKSNKLQEDWSEDVEQGSESKGRGCRYIDKQNCYNWTALMQAASYGHMGCVLYLLQQGANMELLNAWGVSALVLASQGGHFGIVNTLLSWGAKVETVQQSGEESLCVTMTALMAASQCGHVEVVRELLRSGAQMDVKLSATRWTALMLACLNNRVSVVEVLLEAGCNKECKDVQGRTAKDLAMSHGHKNIGVLLAGGKVAKTVSDSEFFDAVSKGNMEKVTGMLREKGSLVKMEIKDGVTPLMLASNKGHKQVCEVLLQGKAEVNVKDKKYGWTALLHATHHKRYDVVELLCTYGADVNMKDNTGSSPYDVATMLGDVQMIQLIHEITLKMLQNKTTPTTPVVTAITVATPTSTADLTVPSETDISSSPAQEVVPATPPPATPPVSQPGPNALKPIDPSEFKRRIDEAYRRPTTDVTTPTGGNRPSLLSPGNSRFPSKRNRTNASQSQPSPFPPSPTSPGGISPNSSSARSLEARPSRAAVPLFLKGNTKPGGVADKMSARPAVSPLRMPSDRAPLRVNNPQRQNGRELAGDPLRGRSPQIREPGSSGSNSPFNFAPRAGLPVKGRNVIRTRPSPSSSGGMLALKSSDNATNKRDLKSVLAGGSLLQYLSLFEAQEVDVASFWTLEDQDLAEMGITNAQDRSKIVSLISSRKSSTGSGRPKSLPFDGFVFQ